MRTKTNPGAYSRRYGKKSSPARPALSAGTSPSPSPACRPRPPPRPPPPPTLLLDAGWIKVLGVQAATDSYIYTFRGFSISRFVERTRPGLASRRRGALQITSGGFVSVRSCGGVRVCARAAKPGFENRRLARRARRANSADSDAGLRSRMEHVTYPRRQIFRLRLRISAETSCLRPVL